MILCPGKCGKTIHPEEGYDCRMFRSKYQVIPDYFCLECAKKIDDYNKKKEREREFLEWKKVKEEKHRLKIIEKQKIKMKGQTYLRDFISVKKHKKGSKSCRL